MLASFTLNTLSLFEYLKFYSYIGSCFKPLAFNFNKLVLLIKKLQGFLENSRIYEVFLRDFC